MTDKFNLNRFIDAQENMYQIALNEIKRGNKSSHWMWYIFPQYKGLGYSSTAQKYAITCVEEASMYYNHPMTIVMNYACPINVPYPWLVS